MKLQEKVKPSHTALVVIDMQNDFCHSDGAFAKYLKWDPSPIQKMTKELDLFANTAKKTGCKLFFNHMMNDPKLSPDNLKERLGHTEKFSGGLWPFGLIKDSWGWQSYLSSSSIADFVFTKKYYDFFSVPEFQFLMRNFGIKTLILTGVYTEVCVLATAQRAFTEGYNVVIPRDLTQSVLQRQYLRREILNLMNSYIAEVVESKDILRAWAAAPRPR